MPVRSFKKAWVVAVDMGYGHERAAFGLEDLAQGGIIVANHYKGIPEKEKKLWARNRELYETISRLQGLPWIGDKIFGLMDRFQRIPSFYPRRDLSKWNLQIAEIYYLIHHGLCKHLIESLSRHPIPLVCTFFVPAYAAEVHGYPGDIYLVICDTDVFRTWAPLDPKQSRIKYLAPNGRVVERLKLYGVPEDRIFLTGFPLPKENIGGVNGKIVKADLKVRIANLDPNHIFRTRYSDTLKRELGSSLEKVESDHPLTLTFSIGGAGAHKQIAWDALRSLRTAILQKRIRFNIEVGTHAKLGDFFVHAARNLNLQRELGTYLQIHCYENRQTYFRSFAHTLRTTDILWTKPSELSFYTGLGLPIIMAPPLGSQEDFNKIWLQSVNGGIPQQDAKFTHEWLFDWINSGGLARFAWNGYLEAPTHGSYRIESIVTGKPAKLATLPLVV